MRSVASLVFSIIILALALTACDKNAAPSPSSRSPASAPAAERQSITIFAAASTVDVINEAARLFKAQHAGIEVKCSFDASSTLAKQILAAAPADVFLSADEKWMDEVAKDGSIDPASRADLLGNQLVLIAPRGKPLSVKFERGFDFPATLPADGRLALAGPTVPAGRYAQQALEHFGWWSGVEKRVVPSQDVRATLRLVERGEADAGIVYSTDAKASKDVEVVGVFPPESHEPVTYPIALVKGAKPQAAEFVAFLRGEAMRKVFADAGFTMLTGEQ